LSGAAASGQRGHALAAAGFADEREGLAALDRQREPVDGFRGRRRRRARLEIGDVSWSDHRLVRSRGGSRVSVVERVAHAVGEQVAARTSVTMKANAAANDHHTSGSGSSRCVPG